MQRISAAIGQVSHAAALRATARAMLALSVGVAMTLAIRAPDLGSDPEQRLIPAVHLFSALLNRGVLVSLFVVAVQLLVYTRLGTRPIGLGISNRDLLLQMGHWIGLGVGLVMIEYLLNPIWEYVEADPAQMVGLVAFSVFVGAALSLLISVARLQVKAEPEAGLSTKP